MEHFPRTYNVADSKEMQDKMAVCQTSPEEFEDRIIFMSTFNDIGWTKKGKSQECFSNSAKVMNFAKRFQLGHWSLFGLGEEER